MNDNQQGIDSQSGVRTDPSKEFSVEDSQPFDDAVGAKAAANHGSSARTTPATLLTPALPHPQAQPPVARLALQSNWLAWDAARGQPANYASEYPFYSDVSVTGEIPKELGPYALLNALPAPLTGKVDVAVVLRAYFYETSTWPGAVPKDLKTNVERYHGGWLPEEMAALCSLALGIRLKAGDETRSFTPTDPLGRPRAHQTRNLSAPSFDRARAIIPSALEVPLIDGIHDRLKTIPAIEANLLTELVRAARAYQDALWIAESEPNLAWLLLVSAVEIAANAHFAESGSPESNLREYQPDLARVLENTGGGVLVEEVANILKQLYSATKKFMRFCETFMPPPPVMRPSNKWSQVMWEWPALKKVLTTVYAHRSHALHAGIPFPAPMCRRPMQWTGDPVVAEIALTGLAENTLGATWVPKDAPISLNTFQYFVRKSILLWWEQISRQ